jgi:hypothetical protein
MITRGPLFVYVFARGPQPAIPSVVPGAEYSNFEATGNLPSIRAERSNPTRNEN